MEESVLTAEEFLAESTRIKANADPADLPLASLLMRAAFPDRPQREKEAGLGPLYLIQAREIRQNYRTEMLALLLERGK